MAIELSNLLFFLFNILKLQLMIYKEH